MIRPRYVQDLEGNTWCLRLNWPGKYPSWHGPRLFGKKKETKKDSGGGFFDIPADLEALAIILFAILIIALIIIFILPALFFTLEFLIAAIILGWFLIMRLLRIKPWEVIVEKQTNKTVYGWELVQTIEGKGYRNAKKMADTMAQNIQQSRELMPRTTRERQL